MVVLGVERWRCGLLGYKKRKRRRRKSCLWAGLIHRGEDSTKSGLKDEKCKKKPACVSVGKIPGQYQSKTIREPKYYKRVQFALTYCSYVHFIEILRDLHSWKMSVKFFARHTTTHTHNTQHTTHNTQHTTHNTQHTTHNETARSTAMTCASEEPPPLLA
jgi:hypothetical protein